MAEKAALYPAAAFCGGFRIESLHLPGFPPAPRANRRVIVPSLNLPAVHSI